MAALSGLIVFGGTQAQATDYINNEDTSNAKFNGTTGAASDLSKGTLDILNEQDATLPKSSYDLNALTSSVDEQGNVTYKNADGNVVDSANVVTKYELVNVTKYYNKETNTLVGADEKQDGLEYVEVRTKENIPHYFEKVSRIEVPTAADIDTTGMNVVDSSNYTGPISDADGAINQTIQNTVYTVGPVSQTITNSESNLIFDNVVQNTGAPLINGDNNGTLTFKDVVTLNQAPFITGVNNGTITGISGTFLNSAGNFLNNKNKVGNINADFINVQTGSLIHNNGTSDLTAEIGNITGNFINSSSYTPYGIVGNVSYGKIGDISGDFYGNTSKIYGGAIANLPQGTSSNPTAGTGIIESITGSFINNHASNVTYDENGNRTVNSQTDTMGGAIYNTGTINGGKITALKDNYTDGYRVAGGAIYSTGTLNLDEIGEISGNYAKGTTRGDGGAIFANSGTIGAIKGDIKDNYIEAVSAYNEFGSPTAGGGGKGGALATSLNIGSVEGNIENNHIIGIFDAQGGAIYNGYFGGGAINFKGSDLKNNYAQALVYNADDTVLGGGVAYGGAIYNNNGSTITGTLGDITENHTEGFNHTGGGAIYSTGTLNLDEVGEISGNHAKGPGASGGAIYAGNGTIGTIKGDIKDNYADAINSYNANGRPTGGANAYGGALATSLNINSIEGNVENNHAIGAGQAYGGAIYNGYYGGGNIPGIINFKGSDLKNNYAQALVYNADDTVLGGGQAYGGAIYNSSGSTITGTLGEISGNYAEGAQASGGAIYGATANNIQLDAITGGITNNHAIAVLGYNGSSNSNNVYGGAIYNNGGNLGDIAGGIKDNYALGPNGTNNSYASIVMGGAIYNSGNINSIEGDITGNYAEGSWAAGGAIYNTGIIAEGAKDAALITITKYTCTYRYQTLTAYKPEDKELIDNLLAQGKKLIIKVVNSSSSNSQSSYTSLQNKINDGTYITENPINSLNDDDYFVLSGGGIVNASLINNHVKSAVSYAEGGAIYNTGILYAQNIGDIKGNYAESDSTGGASAYGGAIYNSSQNFVIDSINGEISDNHVKSSSGIASGGAIYLESGSINGGHITGIKNNYVESYTSYVHSADLGGGAIYVNSSYGNKVNFHINSITGDISNNYVKAENGYIIGGGAIFLGSNTNTTIDEINVNNITDNAVEGVNAYHINGGVISINDNTIGDITAKVVSGNHVIADSTSDGAWNGGGVISKDYGTIGNITFEEAFNNYAEGTELNGGVIRQRGGDIGDITGNFHDNYVNAHRSAYGGVLVNQYGTVGDIKGNFKDNYVTVDGTNNTGDRFYYGASGGGIVNASLINNHVKSANNYAEGGAIYNGYYDILSHGSLTAKIGDITADFTGNHAVNTGEDVEFAAGGAIGNGGSYPYQHPEDRDTIGYIKGNFKDNYVQSKTLAIGGAIANSGDIAGVEGNFENNYVQGGKFHYPHSTDNTLYTGGGAIYNNGEAKIETVKGAFTNNHATAKEGAAFGGAIYDSGAIKNIEADFSGNYSVSEDDAAARGGAIYLLGNTNNNEQTNISGTFTENYAKGKSNDSITLYNRIFGQQYNYEDSFLTAGGAIAIDLGSNNVTINNSSFFNNYAESLDSSKALGGAIYTARGLTINADNYESIFRGNYVKNTEGKENNAIYVNTGWPLKLNATNNGKMIFDDTIDGVNYSLMLDGDETGSIHLNNEVKNATHATLENTNLYLGVTDRENSVSNVLAHENTYFTANTGTIHLEDNKLTDYIVNALTSNNTKYNIDIDWSQEKADRIVLVDHKGIGRVNLNELNILNTEAVFNGRDTIKVQVINNANGNEINAPIQLYMENIDSFSYKPYQPHVTSETLLAAISDVTLETTDTFHDSLGLHGVGLNTLEYICALETINNEKKTFTFTKETPTYTYDGEAITVFGDLTVQGKDENNYIDFSNKTNLKTDEDAKLTLKNSSLKNTKSIDNEGTLQFENATLSDDVTNNGEVVFAGPSNNITSDVNGQGTVTFKEGNQEIKGNFNNQQLVNSGANTTLNDIAFISNRNNSLTMKSGNFTIPNLALNNLTLNALNMNGGNFNINSVDVDLENKKMGSITALDSAAPVGGNINVNAMNVLSDGKEDVTKVTFARGKFKDVVKSDIKEVYTKIYRYDVDYDKTGKDGLFVFSRGSGSNNSSSKFNPAVLTSNVAAQGGMSTAMTQTLLYAFEHGDTFMNMSQMDRFAEINRDTYALSTDFNQNLGPLDLEHKNKSVWVKPFSTFEKINLKNGPKVDVISYGTLVGFDSNIHKMKHGWANVGTAYIGYHGSQLDYSGVDASTNGGLVGLTETFYKGNFWTALTATAGAGVAEAHTMYGHEDMTSIMAGIGSKTGYNIEFKEGKYIIQPRLFLSYNIVNTLDYKNAAGIKIKADPMHTIQLNPEIKIMANTKKGWQPYASVGMVWNLMNETHTTANGVKLPEMHTKPYVEYGIGVQKHVSDTFMAYGQAMMRNGGRNGVALSFGFRWALSKDKRNQKVQDKKHYQLKNNITSHITTTDNQNNNSKKVIKQLSPTQKAHLQHTTRTAMNCNIEKI